MSNEISRRKWLKNTAMLSGGMALLPPFFSSLKASSLKSVNHLTTENFKTDFEIACETTPPEIKARLCFNENPFGPSAKAKQAMRDAIDASYQYTMTASKTMARKIADYEGLNVNQIAFNCGSTPFLEAAADLYGNGTILSANPTYEDMLSKAEHKGAKVVRVPLTADYKFDLDAIEKAIDNSVTLVYICNPNNPTATIVDSEKLRGFCERVSKKTMVFVDEAYMDLVADPVGTTMIPLVKNGTNLIITRTFSKLYGMAGMRFGYMLAQPETIQKFIAVSEGSFNVTCLTWAAALASYQDKEFMKMAYDGIMESKEYLYKILKKEGYEYVPSSTNFAVFPIRESGPSFVNKMIENGVSVRSWKINNKDWCRVSIGKMDEMKDFALALAKIS